MDVLPRITQQLINHLREMPLVQRMVSIGLALVVFVGLLGLMFVNQRHAFQPVSAGKIFTQEELGSAEKALKAAGLNGFRREGQRLLAPDKDLNQYNGVLSASNDLPTDLGAQMLKQAESLGPFTTDRQRTQMKEALLLQELRSMIRAVPEIEDARVAIASSDRKQSWNRKTRATANVMLKPRSGREVSSRLVNSLRRVVASMVPDLDPADVTIFDVTRGQAYSGDSTDGPNQDQLAQRIREMTAQYEEQIEKALSHIPRVSVVVQIDPDTVKSTIARNRNSRYRPEIVQLANRPAAIQSLDLHATGFRGSVDGMSDSESELSEQAINDAIPGAVQINVSIPRDYLKKVTRQVKQTAEDGSSTEVVDIEDQVVSKVERIVASLVPTDSIRRGISVTAVDRLEEDNSNVREASTAESQIVTLGHQYAGPIALSLLAIAGVWGLQRALRPTPAVIESVDRQPAEEFSVALPPIVPEPSETKVTSHDRMTLLRDEIRSLVASDPAASADLLCKWLCEVPQ